MKLNFPQLSQGDGSDITVLTGIINAGKSTLTTALPEELKRPIVGTGDILREAVAAGTSMGLQAKSYMDNGQLVPDEVIMGILSEALSQHIQNGETSFILDGVPRTIAQAEQMENLGIPVNRVIHITVPVEVAQNRASNRRVCPHCKRTYSLIGEHRPLEDGVCDNCHAELIVRKDDADPQVVATRIKTYMEQTTPLFNHYRTKGVPVITVDNSGTTALTEFIEALNTK